ncbi:MAG: Wzz/FepE/Etk N-terminal domain-containing protein [Promicromonosporaceae bacterium]|nr:Wzz/FepE/Etk N-terminal domain-containing protein [Promicromonosporaceae bacterium]
MTLREFFEALWVGKWYVAAAMVVAAAGALGYLHLAVAEYQAVATVELTSATGSAQGSPVVMADNNPATVMSSAVVDAAAAKLHLTSGEVAALPIAPNLNGNTLSVGVTDASPQRAVDVANALADAYVANLPALVKSRIASIDVQIKAMSDEVRQASTTLVSDPGDPTATAQHDAGQAALNTLAQQKTQYLSLVPPGQVTVPARAASSVGFGTKTTLAIALLGGLLLGMVVALVRRAVDPRIWTGGQASRLADAPVLARISAIDDAVRWADAQRTLQVASRAATPFTESVRELRTATLVGLGRQDHAVVVITAADPSAPRAFVAASFAASIALSGRRTVVLGGDMRRPQVEALLPAPAGPSPVSAHGMRPTRVPNLFLYEVPDQPLDPADFLATPRARELVEALRADADVVVVDAPPVLAAADATILSSYADGVVVLARLGKTHQSVLTLAAERLRTNGITLTGLALVGGHSDGRRSYATTYGPQGTMRRRRGMRRVAAPVPASAEPAPSRPADDEVAPLTVPVPRLAGPETGWATNRPQQGHGHHTAASKTTRSTATPGGSATPTGDPAGPDPGPAEARAVR